MIKPSIINSQNARRVEAILHLVAKECSLEDEAMRSHGRKAPLTQRRQLAMWLARKHTDASLSVIGHVFGHRDHTTVMHGIRITEERIREQPEWRALSERLSHKLKQRVAA